MYNYFVSSARGFNSRTPGGVRLNSLASKGLILRFNSRTPGGVRPYMADVATKVVDVSIHAPREGCDLAAK